MKLICDSQAEIEVKRSRFICCLHRADSEEQARDFIRAIRKQHPQARHVCSAIVIDDLKRSSDDGEPSGTAGRPILGVLEGSGADHIVAAVVRYFGGTLLGTGGLVKAYSDAVKAALDNALFASEKTMRHYRLTIPYDHCGKIEAWFAKNRITILDTDYGEKCSYEFLAEDDPTSAIASMTSGRYEPIFIGLETVETAIDD